MAALSFLDREHSVAAPTYNRWLIPPAALAIHLSIGQVYAFSVFKTPLVEHFGSSETAIAVIFSIAIVMLGLSAAFGGTWMERNGPRKAMFLSAVCWTTGFLVAALGVATDQLWLVYLGYGVIGGIGLGIGYISPVSTLIKWFPDRPGLATGLAIMGFGGGALIASPLTNELLGFFADAPEDAIAQSFLTLGIVYFVFMMFGVFTVRVPPADWSPAGYDASTAPRGSMQTTGNVSAASAIRTPQFWLLWTVLFCNVTAGIGILEQASPMIQDFFGDVTPAAAAGFVGLLSIANMAGRFVWSSTSDFIGRKPTYMLYLGVGAVLYFLVATAGSSAVWLFVLLTAVILSFYGGGFATIPAYLKDMFGSYQVGAIHGRLLTAWSAAGVAGPLIVNVITESQREGGAEGAAAYRPSLLVMVGVLVVGFVANLLVREVDRRHHERPEVVDAAKVGAGEGH
ncbi:L-lactate MFS transporter [Vallicoccus soli]|uniref:MFS transporter n=1 Tax=Vallicoccus soli TaxID=2339232 RepID=A0A3A3YS57_9ACTN|nr:OFA family MFS transporter [Vallicoccus soli]RJK94240.1 MFS transporter [Vallicoccus soli]